MKVTAAQKWPGLTWLGELSSKTGKNFSRINNFL